MKTKLHGRKIGKSTLALLITLLMVLSAMPLDAFAAPRPGNGPIVADPMRTATDMPYSGQTAADYPGNTDQGYVQLQKKAEWTDPNIKTHGTVEFVLSGTPVASQGMDAVLVLDKSGSMGSNSKWENAVQAAKDFIDLMFEPTLIGPSPNRISIAFFDSTGQSIGQFYDHNGKQTLKNYIDGKSPGGGTNYGAGLDQAEALFNNQSGTRDKVVVFMSDGGPGYAEGNDITGVHASTRLKNAGVKIYSIGFGVPAGGDAEMYTKNLASDPKQDHYKLVSQSTELAGYFAVLANTMKLAGTNAIITDQINLDNFAIDPTRDIKVDGVKATAGVSVDAANQKITWTAGDILNTPKILSIPVVLNQKYWNTRGVFDTNENDATITYVNHRNANSRKAVQSPALARPYAGVQRVYYEVNDAGEPVDTGGTVLATKAEFENYMVQLGVTGSSEPKGSQVTVTAEDSIAYVNASGRTEYYKYFEGATFSSTPTGKDVTFTILDDNKNYIVYFGYRKLRSQEMTMTKTYNPAVAGAPSANFKIQNITLGEAETNWVSSALDSYRKIVSEDHIFKISEQAAAGYTPVDPFFVKFDGTKVVLVDEKGAPKTYANVSVSGMAITVVNQKDAAQQKDITYTVHYYKDNQEVVADKETVTKKAWIYDTTVAVDASAINTTDKYYGYKLDNAKTNIPATATHNYKVNVYYEPDTSVKHEQEYTVIYFLDGEFDEMEVVKDMVWVGYDGLELKPLNSYPGYKQIEPLTPPTGTRIPNGKTVEAYFVSDPTLTKQINYTVEYYQDGVLESTAPKSVVVWAGSETGNILESAVMKTYPEYVFNYVALNGTNTRFAVKVKDNDVIQMHYKKDTRTKILAYNVKYEKDGVIQLEDRVLATVPYSKNTITIDAKDLQLDLYPNYKVDSTTPAIGTEINENDTVIVKYVRDASKTKTITYKIEHYKNNQLAHTDTVTANTFVDDVYYTVTKAELAPYVKSYPGYILTTDKDADKQVKDGSVITLEYKTDPAAFTEYTIFVKYHDARTNAIVGTSVEVGKINAWDGDDTIMITLAQLKKGILPATDPRVFGPILGKERVFSKVKTDISNGIAKTAPEVVGTNVYIILEYSKITPYDIPIDGLVSLSGKGMKADEFEFEILDENSLTVAEGNNLANGTIAFQTKNGAKIGGADFGTTKKYTIVQTGLGPNAGAANRYTLDTRRFNIMMKIDYDLKTNSPTFEVVSYSAPISFMNRYKAR